MFRHSGEMVKAAMKKKEMTQVELARRIGKDQTLISRYLNGQTEVSVEAARSMAEALGIDFEPLRRQLKRDKLERRKEHLKAEFKEILDEGEEIDLSGAHLSAGAATLMESAGIIAVPLLDSIPSGAHDERKEGAAKYCLPPGVRVDAEESFALKVSGENMTDDVVSEGDIIVIDPGAEVQDDNRVLVILNGKQVLGKIFRKDGTIALQSSRGFTFLSQEDDFEVVGRVVLCIKIFTPTIW